ncbi:acyltransferase family protein [Blastococcus aurantiacus]|nr:acyltransferase [Blastococcus aurantiacus]
MNHRLELLDVLRFVAAMAVLCFHYLVSGIGNGKVATLDFAGPVDVAKYGYLGVDLFFMISGFVISYSALGRTAREFVVGRAVRLYPAFWVAVAFTSALTLVIGTDRLAVTAEQVVVNLTMFPTELGQWAVDGVYWTLLYELYFYALVAVVLLVGAGKRLDLVLGTWAFVMLAIRLLAPEHAEHPLAGGFYALFAVGAMVASIRRSGPGVFNVAALTAAVLVGFHHTIVDETASRAASTGLEYSQPVVAAVLVVSLLSVLSTCLPAVARLRLRHAALLGALTYPVYLIHAHFGYMVFSRFGTEENRWWLFAGQVVAVLGIAWLIHVAVERRSFWRPAFDRTLGVVVGAPAALVDVLRHPATPPAATAPAEPAEATARGDAPALTGGPTR